MLGIDEAQFSAVVDGVPHLLTPTQWYLFKQLWDANGAVVRTWQLQEGMFIGAEVKWHVAGLRSRLGSSVVKTRVGFGYSLNKN